MSERLTILHRPVGTDHPYIPGPDERIPRDPIGGDMVSVGFLTTPGQAARSVRLFWTRNNRPQTPVHGRPIAVGKDHDRWLVELGTLVAGDVVEYWMIAEGNGEQVESPRYRFVTLRQRRLAGISAAATVDGGLILATIADDRQAGPALSIRQLPISGALQIVLGDAPSTVLEPLKTTLQLRHEAVALAIDPANGLLTLSIGEQEVHLRLRWLEGEAGNLAAVEITGDLSDDEAIVGLGERFNAFNQRGQALDVAVYEQYKNHGNRSYLPIPFFASSRGYACLVEGSTHVAYDFGRSIADRWRCVVQAHQRVAIDLFTGDPASCVRALTALTGRPEAAPPDWIFGLWMSSNEWNTQARVEREVALTQKYGIPATVLVIEAWSDETTFYIWNGAQYSGGDGNWEPKLADFSFPADGPWPDPKAMTDRLHEAGIRLILWQIPALKDSTEAHAQHDDDTIYAREHGLVIRQENGEPYRNPAFWFNNAMIPDFTSEQATNWWMRKRGYLLDDMGIDGFKTDGGEHLQGRGIVASDGRHGDELVNAYPTLYIGAYHRFATERRHGDALTFSRAGHTGVGAFPAHWAGDENSNWEAFQRSIMAGLSAGLSGIPFWGWDIAGFSEALPSAELYLRAMAMATFCPIMQYHSEYTEPGQPSKDRTPWRIQEASGDERVIPLARYFTNLRMALLPYLVREAAYSASSGEPLLRALVLDNSDDPICWTIGDQYRLGRDLLIAPVVTEGSTTRRLYLPQGTWHDFWSATTFTGGQWINLPVALDQIPVFVRAGAVIPLNLGAEQQLGSPLGNTLVPSQLRVQLYPSGRDQADILVNHHPQRIVVEQLSGGAIRVALPALGLPVTLLLPDGRSAQLAAATHPQEITIA